MSARPACPPEVLALLPWYPEGALGDAERGRVEAHAASCEACRRELAYIEGSAEPGPETAPDRELLWARTLARIAEGERPAAPARRPVRWRRNLAAAAGVLLALGVGILAGMTLNSDGGPAVYRVAAGTSAPSAGAPELDVIFRPDASAEQIAAALSEVEAGIVSGPSSVSGIYRVRLTVGSDAARAAEQLRAGVASFAEPLPD
jgi:hypothetical protein